MKHRYIPMTETDREEMMEKSEFLPLMNFLQIFLKKFDLKANTI